MSIEFKYFKQIKMKMSSSICFQQNSNIINFSSFIEIITLVDSIVKEVYLIFMMDCFLYHAFHMNATNWNDVETPKNIIVSQNVMHALSLATFSQFQLLDEVMYGWCANGMKNRIQLYSAIAKIKIYAASCMLNVEIISNPLISVVQ